MSKMLMWGLIAVAVLFVIYVRLAPSEPERWHVQAYPSGMGEKPSKRGFIWRETVEGDGMARLRALDAIVMATPRTTRLAGSLEDGQITYVTRSRAVGFPDYTTIGIYEGLVEDGAQRYLEIFGRLRFGRSDLGVNAKRIKGWLRAL